MLKLMIPLAFPVATVVLPVGFVVQGFKGFVERRRVMGET